MAAHLSIGRIPSIPLLVLLGLAVATGTANYLSRSGPEAEIAPAAGIAIALPSPSLASPALPSVSALEPDAAGALPERATGTAARHDPEPAVPAAQAPNAKPVLKSAGAGEADETPAPLATVSPAAPEPATSEPRAPEPAALPVAVAMAPLPAEAEVTVEVVAEAEAAPAAAAALAVPPAPASPQGATPGTAPIVVPVVAPQGRVTVARLVVEPEGSTAARGLAVSTSRPKNMAPIPTRAPRAAKAEPIVASSAATLFKKGAEIRVKKDARVYISSRNIPENDRLLEAYSTDQPNGDRVQTTAGEATAVPGLLGIAAQAQRSQDRGQGNQAYSLADAMRDAIWRKKTAARLKSLSTAQSACADGADDTAKRAPSIGLVAAC